MAIPTPLRRSPSQDADQEQLLLPSVLGSRKTHKTLNNGGLVWPPELEKVLLDALYKYRPPNNPDRDTRLLKRHPMRNKFIADYIKNETGVVRSPKQVGSRLQQMRDTCEDKRGRRRLDFQWDDV
ncbi:hypothetical protein K435DRAFT_318836 [Dendrothele bispora CBS 962.96]|uniref:TEA domain-containing protein n=1 Tax=Dendrothele bispora (strain CBS 962.96) TaxID=1314807 RepID=A0A4S8LGC5_DENBC|nr:hypothetical protein K435DRAFT_318836 [Dendrothele bispora CBS 962.96]